LDVRVSFMSNFIHNLYSQSVITKSQKI